MKTEELEVIDPNTKYEVGTRLLPPKITLEVINEIHDCCGCFFEGLGCGFQCDGIIFKPVFDYELRHMWFGNEHKSIFQPKTTTLQKAMKSVAK